MIVSFPGGDPAPRSAVGGKADSLLRLAAAGLPVPAGLVITTRFFESWLAAVRRTAQWRAVMESPPEEWTALCPPVQALAETLSLDAAQARAMGQLEERLEILAPGALWAVRSSSPEEDLGTASFAGGYETRLGVPVAGLEAALRGIFASCLDARVLLYKHQQGLDPSAPRFAALVQMQIDSKTAGVGFSLNPLTNDYDEAVIDANWGLGESVVAGRVSPDHFVVDRVSRRILERRVGDKEMVIRLAAGGGTVEEAGAVPEAAAPCLAEEQVLELAAVLGTVEELYGHPVDIEWAYAEGRLYLLQARPVTTYVPLPPEMVTAPGERRRLYADVALSNGLTMNAPITPMGLDWMETLLRTLLATVVGPVGRLTPEQSPIFVAGCRMYQDLSLSLRFASPRALARGIGESDALMAATFAGLDRQRYRAEDRPPWLRLRAALRLPGVLGRCWWPGVAFLAACLWPRRARRRYDRHCAAYEEQLAAAARQGETTALKSFLTDQARLGARHAWNVTLPPLGAALGALIALERLSATLEAEGEELRRRLRAGYPENVVVRMGIALFHLAQAAAREGVRGADALAARLEAGEMSPQFLRDWRAFQREFGRRGPLEMDLGRPRYADLPGLALEQLAAMPVDDEAFDPQAGNQRLAAQRREAVEELLSRAGPLRRLLLRHCAAVLEAFAGTRDSPKHHFLGSHLLARGRLLAQGERWSAAGRLDEAEEIFGLHLEDIEAGMADAALDLRERRRQRRHFLEILEARVREFPGVIDSRGRILRPPPGPETPGELRGMAVSAGLARGPVKILHHPREKPVDKGDVLVAYTTDPGWTPLFTNAAAVLLEVGGALQHGVVVAREYGKPCVVGIEGLLHRLNDGDQVEVDGASGIVRRLDEPAP